MTGEEGEGQSWADRRRARKQAAAERRRVITEREQALWGQLRPAMQAIEDEHDIIFMSIVCMDRVSTTGRVGDVYHILGRDESDLGDRQT